MPPTDLLMALIWYGLFPIWLLAGLGDYLSHRRTDIEATSGWRESRLHVVQMLELAPPLLAVLFLRINALVLACVFIALVLHTLTSYWDLAYTTGKRHIAASEQVIHAVLLLFPLFAAALLALIHWHETLALLGARSMPHAWVLELKPDPVPATYLALVLGCTVVFNLLPLLKEAWRTSRVADLPASTGAR